MSNVSIIIQGPLNEISLKNIPVYKKYGKVIVSCWEGYDKELLKYIDDDVCFVSKKLPVVDHYNDHNVYYQASTIYSGLEKSETEFSIKFRSDESYSNLDVFVRALSENPECIVTGDVYFYPDSVWSLHISDHVIGGKTKNLLGAFGRVKNICEKTPTDVRLAMRRRVVALTGGPAHTVLQGLHYVGGLVVGDYLSKFMHLPAPVESLIMTCFLQEVEGGIDYFFSPIPQLTVDSYGREVVNFFVDGLTPDENYRIIMDDNITARSTEIIKSYVRIVPTTCMGDVFLNTHGHNARIHGRLIKIRLRRIAYTDTLR